MDIDTTIYIKSTLLYKISEVASSINVSVNKLIILIILKTMQSAHVKARMFTSVKYQNNDSSKRWRTFHVCFSKNVYEIALDLRKVLKKSVSRIVAEGIEKYLDEIVRELVGKNDEDPDNYSHNYIFIPRIFKGIFFFTIFWGIPSKKIYKKYTT